MAEAQIQNRKSKIQDFESAIAFIQSLDRLDTPQHTHAYAFENGIARARHLLTRLGGAANATTRCVLVAGSKGKGSTVAMLSSVLSAAGSRVGAFTGPHLHTPRERFAIYSSTPPNFERQTHIKKHEEASASAAFVSLHDLRGIPQLISEAQFVAYAERVRHVVETWERPELGLPTRFEAFTAMAYRWFEEQHTDIAVMEVGIGGRLDAVNLGEPILSIITNISLEHTQMLGKTLPEIAQAKAGIMRPNRPVVSAQQADEVRQALRNEAQHVGSDLLFADEHGWVEQVSVQLAPASDHGGQWIRFYCNPLDAGPFEDQASSEISTPILLSLLGDFQLQNVAVVRCAASVMRQLGYCIANQAYVEGLTRVHWPGRFQVLQLHPVVIVDGAHTPHSMAELCASLRAYCPHQRIHFILGTLRDKDSRGILEAAANIATSFTFTNMDARRATAASQLHEIWQELSTLHPHSYPHVLDACVAVDFSSALRQVRARAQPDDVICVTGSLHLAALATEQNSNTEGASVEQFT